MRHRPKLVAATVIALLLAFPAEAKKNDPNITLTFTPQQAVAASMLSPSLEMRERAVSLEVVDARPGGEPADLGARTDDDDNLHRLRAVNEVVPFVEQTLIGVSAAAGLDVAAGSSLRLTVQLTDLAINETNQAVGATYESRVRLDLTLNDASGRALWSGRGYGDATRYGKKFSNENCNEVLSDALLEAFTTVLNSSAMQRAWATGEASPDAQPATTGNATAGKASAGDAASGKSSVAPPDLMAEVLRLTSEGLGPEIIVPFVEQNSLSRAMSSDDLIAWKRAEIADAVIEAVMKLPVR